jgi:hypothetical protein
LHTKLPLSFLKVKIEVVEGDKIFVNNIHHVALLVYKSNGFINKSKRIIENNLKSFDILKNDK